MKIFKQKDYYYLDNSAITSHLNNDKKDNTLLPNKFTYNNNMIIKRVVLMYKKKEYI